MGLSFLCLAGSKMARIASMMRAMRVIEWLFGCNFDDRIHLGQNILGEMAFDLMPTGQFSDAGHFGFT